VFGGFHLCVCVCMCVCVCVCYIHHTSSLPLSILSFLPPPLFFVFCFQKDLSLFIFNLILLFF
jgi:hypothetical protein